MPAIENTIPASAIALSSAPATKWSLDMLIPFDPDMKQLSSIEAIFSQYLEMAEEKLKNRLGWSFSGELLRRIGKIRSSLLSQISGQSLYLGLTDSDEKIIPLNFKTKAAISLDQESNILNVLSYAVIEPHFFIISRAETGESVFEYFNNKLLRIYFNEIPGPPNHEHCSFLSAVMSRSDMNREMPVFVTGQRGGQLTGVCRERVFIEHVSGFSPYNIEHRANTIADNWNYWHKKAIEGRICIAEKNGRYHSGAEEVNRALSKEKNGLLLFDPAFINVFNKTSDEISGKNMIPLIDSFLKRGNRIESMTHPLISKRNGMVFLEHNRDEMPENEAPLTCPNYHTEPALW